MNLTVHHVSMGRYSCGKRKAVVLNERNLIVALPLKSIFSPLQFRSADRFPSLVQFVHQVMCKFIILSFFVIVRHMQFTTCTRSASASRKHAGPTKAFYGHLCKHGTAVCMCWSLSVTDLHNAVRLNSFLNSCWSHSACRVDWCTK